MALRDRDRAQFALEKVQAVRDRKDPKTEGKFRTWLVKLPTHLHVNGLGQTVAFYLSAGKDSPKVEICSWLEGWLTVKAGTYPATKVPGGLIGHLSAQHPAGDARYRRASAEARALSLWLKRFAEAFLEKATEAEE